MKKFIYIAAPYTSNPAKNTLKAIEAAESLSKEYIPIIPHLLHYWHLKHKHSYKFWQEIGLEYLKRCDVMLRLPGKSKGADREAKLAKKLGIPIIELDI